MTSRSYTPTTSIAIHPPYSLHLLLSLPNELLHSIVEYIAYTYEPDRFPVKQTSPELSALSVANWQLRRLCLPFRFAELVIWFDEEIQQMKDEHAHLMKFTKTLIIRDITESGDQALSQIIPQFEQLSDVDLRLVLVNELLDELYNDDLSKMVLDWTKLSQVLSPQFDNYINWGMSIKTLRLSKDESFGIQSGSKILSGLKEIHIFDYKIPDSLSRLPMLSSTYPTLNELWLFNEHPQIYNHDDVAALPLFSFIKESQQQDLDKFLVIKRIGFRRAISPVLLEWSVIALSFTANAAGISLIKILELVALSFSKLEVLNLSLEGHAGMYDIGDLVSAFARFSSLRVVKFKNVFRRLKLRPKFDMLMPPVLDQTDAPEASAKTMIASISILESPPQPGMSQDGFTYLIAIGTSEDHLIELSVVLHYRDSRTTLWTWDDHRPSKDEKIPFNTCPDDILVRKQPSDSSAVFFASTALIAQ
ncbi:hypothetical protein EV360DRAFT_76215 [Lentinula raphanica]|nr:hypothetical protein EV360DRAFT_76215 [Lentinula raphanica]